MLRSYAALVGILLLGACATTQTPKPDLTMPTDGIHITGAVTAVYPIGDVGTCIPNTVPKPELTISSNPRPGEAFFGATVNSFAGPKTYTDIGWPPSDKSTLYVSFQGRVWRATSGLISVKSYGDGKVSGTLWATQLQEVGGSTTVNAAGS